MTSIPAGLQLRSTVTKEGTVELSLASVPTPEPQPDEVVVRVEAAPINPSDLVLLFAAADMTKAQGSGTEAMPVVTAPLSPEVARAMAARVDQPMPVGNEGAGVVIAAGASAQALLGKTVALAGGGMYAQYRTVRASQCLVLPPGITPAEGASSFVNPLTALGMLETMRREGHTALVHTAAASNLGQMLQKLCLEEGVPLVNVVRRREQAEVLEKLGAKYVCDSSSATFFQDLTEAIAATGATLAFDAVGGGELASHILNAMELAATRRASDYSRYGSSVHKQVYIYGMLDRGPTVLHRRFGLAWGIGGWLLTPFLQKLAPVDLQRLRERVVAGLRTTFASHYTKEVSLAEALSLDSIRAYGRMSTGEKFLVRPQA